MKLWRHPLKALSGLIDRAFAAVGAALFSQAPAFVTHYQQRLGGHVDEAARNVKTWQNIANSIAQGCLDTLVRMGQASHEAFSQEAARKCAEDMARYDALRQALDAVQNAPVWLRSAVFLRHADMEIARATARNFTPNLPMNAEGLMYALVGLIFGVALFTLLKKACEGIGRALRKRFARKADPPDDGTDNPQGL